MKRAMHLLCLVLAVLMVLGLAACNNTPAGGTEPGNEPTTGGTANNPYGIDFGGKTIKVAVWYEPEIPMLGNSDSEDAWYYSLKNACEAYNCKIEWIVDTQDNHFAKFIQKSLSGESYADIMMCHSWNYISLIQQELILPTTEYVSNASDAEHWESELYNVFGENWGLQPKSQNRMPIYYYLVNTKVLNSLGLEHPQELVRRGEWTWEKFREYCAAATDPALERYGVGPFNLNIMLQNTNDFETAYVGEDGVYYNAFTHEDTKQRGLEILEFMEDLAWEDKSVLPGWVAGQESSQETLNAFKDGRLLFAFVSDVSSLKKSGFEDYSVVTAPIGPSGTQITDTVEAFAFWSLPKYSNYDPEDLAMFWMEAKRIWDPEDEEGYYEEDLDDRIDELLNKSFQSRADVEFLFEMGSKIPQYPIIALRTGSLVADDLFGAVLRGDTTPAAAIDATAGELQAIIDATYNNK